MTGTFDFPLNTRFKLETNYSTWLTDTTDSRELKVSRYHCTLRCVNYRM